MQQSTPVRMTRSRMNEKSRSYKYVDVKLTALKGLVDFMSTTTSCLSLVVRMGKEKYKIEELLKDIVDETFNENGILILLSFSAHQYHSSCLTPFFSELCMLPSLFCPFPRRSRS